MLDIRILRLKILSVIVFNTLAVRCDLWYQENRDYLFIYNAKLRIFTMTKFVCFVVVVVMNHK